MPSREAALMAFPGTGASEGPGAGWAADPGEGEGPARTCGHLAAL